MDNGEIHSADRMTTETVVSEGISYQDSINTILQKLNNDQNTFISIGWNLKHIKQDKLYQQEEYKNIYEFAEDKFRLKKSTVSRFINLCEQFSVNHDSPVIAEEYKEFSMSQLEEMLSMKPEDMAKITPDMTVKQIREVKRKAREEDMPEEIVATSQQSKPEHTPVTVEEEQPEHTEFANDRQDMYMKEDELQDDVQETDIQKDNRNHDVVVTVDKTYISNGYIINEFDPDNLEISDETSYVTKKYIEFYKKKGYIPRYFNAYNCKEITDTAPTLITKSDTKQGSGSILFFYVKEEIAMILNDETIEEDSAVKLIKKLLRIAAPNERKKAEEFLLKCRLRVLYKI